jgi:hypothetical protein
MIVIEMNLQVPHPAFLPVPQREERPRLELPLPLPLPLPRLPSKPDGSDQPIWVPREGENDEEESETSPIVIQL